MKRLRLALVLTALLPVCISCSRKNATDAPDVAFTQYIKAYTGGLLTKHSTIRIELAQDVSEDLRLQDHLFKFSPAIKGSTVWTGPASVEFIPQDETLVPLHRYEASFALDKVCPVKEKELGTFRFSFLVKEENDAPSDEHSAAPSSDGRKEGFRVLSVTDEGDHLDVEFSEELSDNATLKGLVDAQGAQRSYTKVSGAHLLVYYTDAPSDITLVIDPSVKSKSGTPLGQQYRHLLARSQTPPAAKILLKGNIMPDKGKLILPVATVNLSAIDIKVIQIFEDNVLMFLQDNDLDGDSELRRAGRLVYSRTFHLDELPGRNLHEWNEFGFDLSGLMRREKGAIYRIRVSFKQEYSLYGREPVAGQGHFDGDGTPSPEESAVWDEPYCYYWDNWYDWSNYDYKDRDNPDTPSYYMDGSRFPSVNLMNSNVGLMAQYGTSGTLWISVTDLMSAKPLSGASVDVYNFQLQKIASGKTGSDGLLALEPTQRPFAVVASSSRGTAYLKVNDGGELPMSRFDIGGKTMTDGLKGYIYGERGVWRPGDTLHLSLILSENGRSLPQAHPVTLELFSPEGQFYTRQIKTGTDGFYCFDVATSKDDPTGFWNAYFKVGGSTFHKTVNIETIKPNRLKVSTVIGSSPLQAGWSGPADVRSSWLTGPAASGLKAKATLILRSGKTAFKDYGQYRFDAPLQPYKTSEHELFEVTLNPEGHATPRVTLPKAPEAAGMLQATVISTVTEKGGDESFVSESFSYSPYTHYVGVNVQDGDFLATGKDQVIKLVTVDATGKACAGRTVNWSLYKIGWSWWWENQGGSLDSYVNASGTTLAAGGSLKTGTDAGAAITFNIPSEEWGRYLLLVSDPDSGHCSGASLIIDWPDYQGRSDRRDPQMLSMLSFSTDKKNYMAGETATVYIPAAEGGRALVSIEKASGILSRKWVRLGAQETAFRIPVSADMAPNFYVHITLVQPCGTVGNDLPIRLYGVQKVMVDNPLSRLEPQIQMPSSVHPEQEFTIRIKEKQGRKMTYTLALVDEGLLDITAFKTPDAWNEMYAPEALKLKTWDMYDDVIGSRSGPFSVIAAIGGDEGRIVSARKDNRFNPVVRFIGPVTVEKGGTAEHKIKLPMYVGSLRAMVVAAHDGAFGSASGNISVKSALMVLPSLPRVLSAGETISLPVNVFAMDDGIKNVTVNVEAEGAVSVDGPARARLDFNAQGDRMAWFSLKALTEGSAMIKVSAASGNEKVSEQLSIEVRNPNPRTVSVSQKLIPAGSTAQFPAGPDAILTLSTAPSVSAGALAEMMTSYPYDCSEQLSSRGLSLLCLRGQLDQEAGGRATAAIEDIITRLYSRQRSNGGFVYWDSSKYTDPWVSSMAGEFLCKAAADGFAVSESVLSAWKKYQRTLSNAYSFSPAEAFSQADQSYRLYTLAACGSPDTGAMNRLKEAAGLDSKARWALASAYALTGNINAARSLLETDGTSFAEYSPYNVTYGSALRDKALATEAFALCSNIAQALPLAKEIASEVNAGAVSTAEAAFAIKALEALKKTLGDNPVDVEILGEKGPETVVSAQSSVSKQVGGPFEIHNNGEGDVFATLVNFSQDASSVLVPQRQNSLRLSVSYMDAQGAEISPGSLTSGTEFTVSISVSGTNEERDLSHLALCYILPSGWEAVQERLILGEGGGNWDNLDLRDDRIIWYFDLPGGVSREFRFKARAAWAGKYILPPTSCTAMYEPSVSANTASSMVAVVR